MSKKELKKWTHSGNGLFLLIMCIVMVVATSSLGALLTVRFLSELKTVLWGHMESVATLSATLIDGDELKMITEEDAPVLDATTGSRIEDGSELYSKIERQLLTVKSAQEDLYIPNIYITRWENGRQVFVVDPDKKTPAKYGQEAVYTPTQAIAWGGKSKVDDKPYSDEWGHYYTAWSPIKDSAGKVVGLVGVDFDATQITKQINYSLALIISSSSVLLILSITFFMLYSYFVRKRSRKLGREIADLSHNLKTMFDEIEGIETKDGPEEPVEEDAGQDFMKYVHSKTLTMTRRLREHTAYMQQQANVDYMTKVGNTRAYAADKEKIRSEINADAANFAVAVFDVNNLKGANDKYGHVSGDMLIKAASEALRKTFADCNIYRIGGDEFTVILPGRTAEDTELLLKTFGQEVEKINRTIAGPVSLSIAKGYAVFDPKTDKAYRDVFNRADHNMYMEKESQRKICSCE